VTARTPFFGPLPERGVWTALSLTRAQFLAILALSVALFLLVGGPLWNHLHDGHATRLVVSYAVIPLAVLAALARNRLARPLPVLVASVVIALVKLVLTAALLLVLALLGRQ
jgi:hypothetical protein